MMTRRLVLAILFFVFSSAVTIAQDNSLQSAANQAARSQLVQVLVTDLDELIPGEYGTGTELLRKLEEIANAYITRDQLAVERLMGELIAADPNVPPRELLLAGMAFATNNPGNGSILLERGAVTHKNHPGFALAFSRLALLQNRFFDSVALAEKAMRMNQDSDLTGELKRFYEISSVALLTIIELRRNELTSAEQYARRWENLVPDDDKMLLASAEVRFNQLKLESSVEYLNRRSAEKQAEIPTEVVIGKWYQVKRDAAKQEQWITEAFQKHPTSKLAQIEYAAILLRKEKFDEALSMLEKYEQQFGSTSDSMLIKGRISFSKQDYKTAGEIFAELFKRQPNNFENAYLHMLALLENPDDEIKKQALPLSQRVYQLFPNNQLSIAVAGWALLKTGSVEAGGELIQQSYNPNNLIPDIAYFLASFMKTQGRNVQALRILEPVLSTQEIFLFRSKAQQLVDAIKLEDNLPSPGSNK